MTDSDPAAEAESDSAAALATLASITPDRGYGLENVTLLGKNLQNTSHVKFGQLSVIVDSPPTRTAISCKTPSHIAGKVPVIAVDNNHGETNSIEFVFLD